MRDVKIDNTLTLSVRGLTRNEVKQFKKEGFNVSSPSPETADDMLDKLLETALTEEQVTILGEKPYHCTTDVYKAIMKETYGAPDEEKNLSASSNGEATQNG